MIRDANIIERELRIAQADLMKLGINAYARKAQEKRVKALAKELALTVGTLSLGAL
jgi:ribosome-binding ATPase YchF (GTP1/OBG family)